MNYFTDKVAVVTGAASGLGRELAIGLAQRGARVAMCDVDEGGLNRTAEALHPFGVAPDIAVVDVSQREAVAGYAQRLRRQFGAVHQLYNNAGVATDSSSVLDTDYAAYERIIAINLWGVINGTKEFLPHLIESGAGHLVNMSSINGIMGQAAGSAYCTTKFAVRGFTESVRADMIRDRLPVKVTVVHPGGIKTNIATSQLSHLVASGNAVTTADRERLNIFNAKVLKIPPHQAANSILKGVAASHARILIGSDARVLDALVRIAPATYPKVAAWLDRRLFGWTPATAPISPA